MDQFLQVGYRFIQESQLSLSVDARWLLLYLHTYNHGLGYVWPSRKRMALENGISERKVTRLIKELNDKGFIKTKFRRNQTNIHYLIQPLRRMEN